MSHPLEQWYLARIVYRICCGADESLCQFDEQLRLVMAGDAGEAISRAKAMGHHGEMQFFNDRQQLVSWQFVNVSELYRLGAHMDGAEVFSAITEVSHAGQFMQLVHDKAARLIHQAHPSPLNLL